MTLKPSQVRRPSTKKKTAIKPARSTYDPVRIANVARAEQHWDPRITHYALAGSAELRKLMANGTWFKQLGATIIVDGFEVKEIGGYTSEDNVTRRIVQVTPLGQAPAED